jgi:hypothetical protein
MPKTHLTVRSALGLLAASLTLGAAQCAKDPVPMTWKELQPLYFSSLNLTDDATLQGLPDFEQRLDAVADGILLKLDNGELTDDMERLDAGLALFYQGLLLHVAQHGIEDGYIKAQDYLRPQRYAAGGDDTAEEYARLARSNLLLMHAAELRPDDTRIQVAATAAQYNQQVLDGKVLPSLQLQMLDAARADMYGLLSIAVLWRDEDSNPANASNMTQLLDAMCAADRFNCGATGMPSAPPRPIDGERKLTLEVNGQVLASDLLVRRAETLLQKSDATPDPKLLADAQTKLQFASSLLGFARANAMDPQLSQYPATSHLPPRADRIGQLLDATQARIAGMPDPPALPDTSYYTSRDYRAAYQCVACHTKGPTTMGFPK